MKYLIIFLLLIASCKAPLDPERVEYHFKQCMEQAEKSGLLGRVMSPTDECNEYAERQTQRERDRKK